MKRGELWWASVDKRRPVILVSRKEAYELRAAVIVAPTSTKIRGFSTEVRLGRSEGLPRPCVINCDWLVTLRKDRLVEKIGALSAAKLRQLDDALRFSLGLDD
jgi:mRNA interferase MazF